MLKKTCPNCQKPSYSAGNNYTWLCPYCGGDITEVKAKPVDIIQETYKELLNEIISKPFEVQKYARDNNIVFDNMDDKWQRFAFRLYTMLVNLSMQAMEVEEELDGGDLKSLQKARE